MEFPFPPPPPGYTGVRVARWLLVAWAFMGLGILIVRFLRREFIKPREMTRWVIAAVFSSVVAMFGYCPFPEWDSNQWLVPTMTAVISVSIAGIAMGLAKLYTEGFAQEIRRGLLVAAIIFVLAVVFLSEPAVQTRGVSRRFQCTSSLRQNGMALIVYQNSTGSFPPPVSSDGLTSWRVTILPLLDCTSLFRTYDRTVAWNRPPNTAIAEERILTYACPSNYFPKDERRRWFTAYSMPTGPHTVGANPQGTKDSDITDGTSNTLLLVESSGAQIIWTEPRDVNVESRPAGINLNGNKPGHSAGWLSGYHRGGVNVQMADGSVRFLSTNIDLSVLKKLATIDGGERITAGEY